MTDSVDDIKAANLAQFMKRGPALSRTYRLYIVAKDTAREGVLIGGMGSCGVGQMWLKKAEFHENYAGWDEAPEQECTFMSLFEKNIKAETDILDYRSSTSPEVDDDA